MNKLPQFVDEMLAAPPRAGEGVYNWLYLRRDPVVPELIGVRRVASQSALSQLHFADVDSARIDRQAIGGVMIWNFGPQSPKSFRYFGVRVNCYF